MELGKYFQLLYRYRMLLIAVPLIALLATYFLVRNRPDTYLSQTNLSSGFIDPTKNVLANEDDMMQQNRIDARFSNLIETIRLGKVIDQVSYSLIIHDLTEQPFHPYSKLLSQLNPDAKAHALHIYKQKYENRLPLNLAIPDEAGLNAVLVAEQYDRESIDKDLTVYRTANSDFVHMEFTSQQPELSAFVLNTLCNEVIAYTNADQQSNNQDANVFLRNLMQQKLDTLDNKLAALKDYKIKNRILDLKDASTELYTQLSDYQNRKAQAEKDLTSYQSAITNINNRFNPQDRRYLEASEIKINGEVAATRDRLASANDNYIQHNFDPKYKKITDSLQNELNTELVQMSDKYVTNPLAGKESLVQEKVKMEISLDMTKSGLKKLNTQIADLNSQLDHIVPFSAAIASYERDIDVATKEYIDIQNKYNQSSIESNLKSTLKQVAAAMPGLKQPSKKIILILLSAALSFAFCLLVMFVIYFLDNGIRLPVELANATQFPVLGQLNLVTKSAVDYKRIGHGKESTDELQQYKNLLRSIRYEIDAELHGPNFSDCIDGKVLAITSMNAAEGKSLVCMSLASAYAMANKRVLVVDGNFDNPSLTNAAFDKTYLEDFLCDEDSSVQQTEDSLISVLGNKGGDYSLLEKTSEFMMRKKITQLKKTFDVIIIETQSLSLLNKAKEWIYFADNVVAVFEANQTINGQKQNYIDYLKTLDSKFIGLIMNKVTSGTELELKQAS